MVSQGRTQIIAKHSIAFLEAHLAPLNERRHRQVINDFIILIDSEFPERTGEDLEKATRDFLATWQKATWPTIGQFIRGLTANMPKLQTAQIAAQPKPDPEKRAAALLRSDLGQQAIAQGVASWLWDWAMKNPDRDPPADILAALKSRDAEMHKHLSLAAAGEPGPLTMNETPADPAKDWAIFALEQMKRREASMATWYGP